MQLQNLDGRNMKNKAGMEVPHDIERKAREMGCNQGVTYVYKDGKYGDGFPCQRQFSSPQFRRYKIPHFLGSVENLLKSASLA